MQDVRAEQAPADRSTRTRAMQCEGLGSRRPHRRQRFQSGRRCRRAAWGTSPGSAGHPRRSRRHTAGRRKCARRLAGTPSRPWTRSLSALPEASRCTDPEAGSRTCWCVRRPTQSRRDHQPESPDLAWVRRTNRRTQQRVAVPPSRTHNPAIAARQAHDRPLSRRGRGLLRRHIGRQRRGDFTSRSCVVDAVGVIVCVRRCRRRLSWARWNPIQPTNRTPHKPRRRGEPTRPRSIERVAGRRVAVGARVLLRR